MCQPVFATGFDCAHVPDRFDANGWAVPRAKEYFMQHGVWLYRKCDPNKPHCPNLHLLPKPSYEEMTRDGGTGYWLINEGRRPNPDQQDHTQPNHWLVDKRCSKCREIIPQIEGLTQRQRGRG